MANTALAAMYAVTTWFLWHAGEARLDAYLALYTLEYLVVKAVARPRRVARDWLAAALVAAFFAAAAYRIARLLL